MAQKSGGQKARCSKADGYKGCRLVMCKDCLNGWTDPDGTFIIHVCEGPTQKAKDKSKSYMSYKHGAPSNSDGPAKRHRGS